MQYVSKDRKFGINLPLHLLYEMHRYCISADKMETGGILIGQYSENQKIARISHVSGPPHDSKFSFTWFNRGIKGLKKIINSYWDVGQYYVGEWHFHPYSAPSPSAQDRQQMKSIALNAKYNCPEPILIIIGGSDLKFTLRAFIATKKSDLIELFPEGLEPEMDTILYRPINN